MIINYCVILTIYGYNSVLWHMLSMKYLNKVWVFFFFQWVYLHIYWLQDQLQIMLETIVFVPKKTVDLYYFPGHIDRLLYPQTVNSCWLI